MRLLLRGLALAWLAVVLQTLLWVLDTPATVWDSPLLVGRLAALTNAVTILCGPLAVIQLWRGDRRWRFLTMSVAGASLLFYSLATLIHGSAPGRVASILVLSSATLATLITEQLQNHHWDRAAPTSAGPPTGATTTSAG
jgi:hypothetical protein